MSKVQTIGIGAVSTWTDFTVGVGTTTLPRADWTAWKFFVDVLPNAGCADVSVFVDDVSVYAKAAPKA